MKKIVLLFLCVVIMLAISSCDMRFKYKINYILDGEVIDCDYVSDHENYTFSLDSKLPDVVKYSYYIKKYGYYNEGQTIKYDFNSDIDIYIIISDFLNNVFSIEQYPMNTVNFIKRYEGMKGINIYKGVYINNLKQDTLILPNAFCSSEVVCKVEAARLNALSNNYTNFDNTYNIIIPKSYKVIEGFGINARSIPNHDINVYYLGTIDDWLSLEFAMISCKISYSLKDNFLENLLYGNVRLFVLNNKYEFEEVKHIEICDEYDLKYSDLNLRYLNSIKVNSTIKNFNWGYLNKCTSLKEVYFNGSLEQWFNINFEVPKEYQFKYQSSFKLYLNDGNNYIEVTSILLPQSIKKINSYQLFRLSNVESVELHEDLKEIDSYAFTNLSDLTSVYIPKSVEVINSNAFYNCPNLTIYCEAESLPPLWSEDFSGDCNVVWNIKNNQQ